MDNGIKHIYLVRTARLREQILMHIETSSKNMVKDDIEQTVKKRNVRINDRFD